LSSALVFLARHGETEWTVTRRHTGSTDVPLTDAGELQAVELGQLLTRVKPDRVLSSPLTRALDTARLAGFEGRIEQYEALQEYDYGGYEGLTSDQIRAGRPGWDLFRDGCPGGEMPEQVAARVKPLLDEIVAEGQRVIIFGHGHCLRILAATYLGLAPSAARHLFLDTASLSLLGTEHDWPTIRHWNQVAR
jgi:broad specificity phosphatase PhoE